MSTKLRIAVEVEGIRFFGKQAKQFIKDAVPRTTRVPERLALRPMKERIEWAFERIPYEHKKLFLFREPARIKPEDSKYKQLLKDWGMRDNTRRNAQQRAQTRRTLEGMGIRWVQGGHRAATPRPTPAPATTPENRRVPEPVIFNEDTLTWVPAQTAINFFGEQMPGGNF